ncbi:hypothetical protein MTF65_04060 [Streptomyces sp. APSN-46.1]|uniref:hypothetical protein n=1 Tax=Streptomyces sp. APSN-46.1 TaxID=2929049 RepID=UPI001FB30403|nr:hypothetical protein [Streptomyces sp. APSN-46.1]MCJ1676535.1 hypothetical protein [Streptomyces sp. APSN-46.1]
MLVDPQAQLGGEAVQDALVRPHTTAATRDEVERRYLARAPPRRDFRGPAGRIRSGDVVARTTASAADAPAAVSACRPARTAIAGAG